MISTDTTILDHALHYAREWRVYVLPLYSIEPDGSCACGKTPCASPGKHPTTKNGLKDASRDETQIRAWFESGQNLNIGLATGKASNLAVVDVDYDNGADLIDLISPECLNGKTLDGVLDTISVYSGKGVHFHYSYPTNFDLKNSASKLGKGIDIRGEGGYVVAPPSRHANGKTYEFSPDNHNLREFPTEWIDILLAPKNSTTNSTNGTSKKTIIPPPADTTVPDAVPTGARNQTLASLAGKMRFNGFGQAAIESALLAENERICQPPLDDAEVRRIARSIVQNYQPAPAFQNLPPVTVTSAPPKTIENWDDVSISQLFTEDFADKLRYNPESKKWLVWTGTHWEFDRKNLVISKATEFSQNLYTRVLTLIKTQADMKTAHRQISKSNSSNGLKAFLELAKPLMSSTSDEFDQNPYLLNYKNGTIDLRTGAFSAHEKTDFITKICPFDYDENAQINEFDKFLKIIQPHPEIRRFIQLSIGYSLLGLARERTFWILYGNGNNGKSVFIELFSELLKDYASSTTSASVMNSKNDRIPNDIARLNGKRFIVIPETEENERLNASLIKALSAGDKITARFLFGEFFDFYFSGKLWIATNHKPTITDHSKGFWDRLKIIPFTVDIPKQSVIKRDTLLKNLLTEAPAILAWAVRGTLDYFQQDALHVPDIIQKEIDDYKYEQDSIAQFIDECCHIGQGLSVENSLMYQKYTDFCKDNGEYQRTQRRFSQNLKERGFSQQRTAAKRYWEGVMMKT